MNSFSLYKIFNNTSVATIYLILLNVQFISIEGDGTSILKVSAMLLAPILFYLKSSDINKALVWGVLYWLMCLCCSSFHDGFRFSTLGYLGMFIATYILFYSLIYKGAYTLDFFINLLKRLIIAYGVVLLLQQLCMIIGIHHMPIINLSNQFFLELTKLPSLSVEPSHTARILTVAMLAYWRCCSIKKGNQLSLKDLINKEHRGVTFMFFWTMITMGSGTAFVGIAILSLYFVNHKTIFYVIPLFITLFILGQQFELKHADRAIKLFNTLIQSGDVKKIRETDSSGAYRLIPLVNTVMNTDYTKAETWFGTGIQTREYAFLRWKRTTDKLAIIEQYGFISLVISIILFFKCAVRKIFCIETLVFVILFNASLVNIYFIWGCLMIFTAVRYFQELDEKKLLEQDESLEKK